MGVWWRRTVVPTFLVLALALVPATEARNAQAQEQPAPDPASPSQPGQGADGGDADPADGAARTIPPDAQREIDNVRRTPARNNDALVSGVQRLVEAGRSVDDAIRRGLRPVPVAGPHLSGVPASLRDGQPVATGDIVGIVGIVGDSGNARGGPPHVHVGIYSAGRPSPPKPVLDGS